MQKFNITITNTARNEEKQVQAKSEANMWNILREARNQLTESDVKGGVRAVVTTEDGKTFKDITFKMNSKGKIEMPNAVKETCRAHRKVAKKAENTVEVETPAPVAEVSEAFADREAELK